MSQFKIQLLGIALALTTAIGCLAYEKLCKAYPYYIVGFLASIAYVPFWTISRLFKNGENLSPKPSGWWVIIFILSGVTSPIWYLITRQRNVITGAVFEIKYIAVLVLCSIIAGNKEATVNTYIGTLLAMASIYFISK